MGWNYLYIPKLQRCNGGQQVCRDQVARRVTDFLKEVLRRPLKSCLSMNVLDILCGISMARFEIPHKISYPYIALQWRHNGRLESPASRLFTQLFIQTQIKNNKTSKLRVTGLCEGNSPGTGEFPAQMASNAENISIWWRHHGNMPFYWEVTTQGLLSVFETIPMATLTLPNLKIHLQ